MSRTYEAVYIFDSTLEESAITEKLDKYHAMLAAEDADAPSVDHWGKRTLAYPISGRETGYYVVAKFTTEAAALPEYERALKLDESLLRHLIVLDEGAQMSSAVTGKDGEEDE